jgi:hypothetical protein
MPKYSYVAMDARGKETKGTLEVTSQNEAIGRVKEMGLFPTKIVEVEKVREKSEKKQTKDKPARKSAKKGFSLNINIPGLSGRVKTKVLTAFTRVCRCCAACGCSKNRREIPRSKILSRNWRWESKAAARSLNPSRNIPRCSTGFM